MLHDNGPKDYGFIITHDMLDPSVENGEGFAYGNTEDFNLDDPRQNSKGFLFRLYDDDNNLYFKGRLIFPGWNTDANPGEEYLTAPLFRFGIGYGCTMIKFHGKPEWTIG